MFRGLFLRDSTVPARRMGVASPFRSPPRSKQQRTADVRRFVRSEGQIPLSHLGTPRSIRRRAEGWGGQSGRRPMPVTERGRGPAPQALPVGRPPPGPALFGHGPPQETDP